MTTFLPIAIVGRASILPGARDVAALWELVQAKRSAIRDTN